MRAIIIGGGPRTIECIESVMRLRWPDVLTICTDKKQALEVVGRAAPDLVFVQASSGTLIPDPIIKDISRENPSVGLIVVADAMKEMVEDSRMQAAGALHAGADDYIKLPCSPDEFVMRIFALVRRIGAHLVERDENVVRKGDLMINSSTCEAFLGQTRVVLTVTEFRLLQLLMENQGHVVLHRTIRELLWGDRNVGTDKLVKKHIQRLRRKLGDNAREPTWIANVHGVGYRFVKT